MNNDTRLYILMRTDRDDMNPGKAVAQGTHAANQCIFEARKFSSENDSQKARDLEAKINEWENQSGNGFGTCIVLGVDEQTMRDRVRLAKSMGIHAGITHDPSYPTSMPQSEKNIYISNILTGSSALLFIYGIFNIMIEMPLFGLFWLVLSSISFFFATFFSALGRLNSEFSLIPLDTCAYVFGGSDDLKPVVGDLSLMR